MTLSVEQIISRVHSEFTKPHFENSVRCNEWPAEGSRIDSTQFKQISDSITQKLIEDLNLDNEDYFKEMLTTLIQGNVKQKYLVSLSSEQRTPEPHFIDWVLSFWTGK